MEKVEKIISFEDLDCWKACRNVRLFIIGVIKNFPDKKRFALTDGLRRSSRSITENIAEGFGRYHYQENIQFCRYSRGSLHEIIDQLITAMDEKYISKKDYFNVKILVNTAIGLLNGYINYLKNAKKSYDLKLSLM